MSVLQDIIILANNVQIFNLNVQNIGLFHEADIIFNSVYC